MADVERKIWKLGKNWSLPFVGAWRTFEATINPAFYFTLICGNCKMKASLVWSVKKKKRIIGIECEDCGQTLKFERPLEGSMPDMPDRLKDRPHSQLTTPAGQEAQGSVKPDDVLELVLLDE